MTLGHSTVAQAGCSAGILGFPKYSVKSITYSDALWSLNFAEREFDACIRALP